jgi:hypothetical protein
MTLDATVGGATSNSYTDVTAADAYLATHPFAASWTAAVTADKETALQYATAVLDRERWAGAKGMTPAGSLTQALSWPRRWAPTLELDASPQFVTEYWIDTSITFYSELTIPTPLVRATCELALVILDAGTTDPFTVDATRVKRETVDVISTEYFDSQDRVRGLAHYPHVAKLVAHLLRDNDGAEVRRA